MSNLLHNAAKYTERGGCIWLIAERSGDAAMITVRDTGVGIPRGRPAARLRRCSPRANKSDSDSRGLGIGLTLVKRLVGMHDGTVTAESAGPDMGSTFVIRLPAIAAASGSRLQAPAEVHHMSPPALRMLIVDDNRDAADSLAMLLRTTGNEIRTAYDGVEALQVAGEFRPEVVLLDIGLPKVDGHEVARRLRREPWGQRVCLIAVTGWSDDPIAPGHGPRASTIIWSSRWTRPISTSCWIR